MALSLNANNWNSARKIIEKRCVTCHSCYSAPCQLKLESYKGLERGGKNDPIYFGSRLIPQDPTRLGIDANTTEEWRKKHDFFSVIGKNSSLLSAVKRGSKRKTNYQLGNFTTKQDWSCRNSNGPRVSTQTYQPVPMPFGFPPVQEKELQTLVTWGETGFKGPGISENPISKDLNSNVRSFESYLNQSDLKSKIVSRYLYEHLFISHIYFEHSPKPLFRLVRSRTAFPLESDEIATRRPFDSPGKSPFFYRLVKIEETIMHKNNILFALNPEKIARLKNSLNKGSWVKEPQSLPTYNPHSASNPFRTFRDMPLKGRYRFFLENAHYFIMSFIRGPVCEGQVAVNVIRDHFATIFVSPDSDLSIVDPTFLIKAAPYLDLPASGQNSPFETYYKSFKDKNRTYVEFRAKEYRKSKINTSDIRSVWDGEKQDKNSALTVFRHFDTASVIKGFWGTPSKTVWLLDYPIFERIYYLLVAGFDVFGNVFHQSSTRLYMDHLRVESENNFLYLLPQDEREAVKESWYVDEDGKSLKSGNKFLYNSFYQNPIPRKNDSIAKASKLGEIYQKDTLAPHLRRTLNPSDPYCCGLGKTETKNFVTQEIRKLTARSSSFAKFMPEVSLLAMQMPKTKKLKIVFLSKLTSHKNVAFMLNEKNRLEPSEDRVIATDDWVGSYPNLFFQLDIIQLRNFVGELTVASSQKSVDSIFREYAILRDRSDFWSIYDRIESNLKTSHALGYGRLDLSKYSPLLQKKNY